VPADPSSASFFVALGALAVDGEETQIRSYPGSHDGFVARAGYEHFLALELPGTGPRLAQEAETLLHAPACPSGRTTLILAGEQLGLQLHESVGHAVELDRVLGREASYAGTSFVAAADAGSLRFGSEVVNVTADATTPRALGSYRWDDEGVEAQALPIVRAGTLVGFFAVAWPTAEFAGMNIEGAVKLGYRKELLAIEDLEALVPMAKASGALVVVQVDPITLGAWTLPTSTIMMLFSPATNAAFTNSPDSIVPLPLASTRAQVIVPAMLSG